MAYQPNPTKVRGGQREIWTADEEARGLLRQLLIEIKKLNLQFELITGVELKDSDV